MHISFQIQCRDLDQFIKHWSSKYSYKDEYKYNENIGKPLTEQSKLKLFEWKNVSEKIAAKKMKSISDNYPLKFEGDEEKRYLNHKMGGGAIWNIFYIHCLNPMKWPIYDQHTHRAMGYLITGKIVEIGNTNKHKFESYIKEYIPFIRGLGKLDSRTLDKALFTYGQFLKKATKYT